MQYLIYITNLLKKIICFEMRDLYFMNIYL